MSTIQQLGSAVLITALSLLSMPQNAKSQSITKGVRVGQRLFLYFRQKGTMLLLRKIHSRRWLMMLVQRSGLSLKWMVLYFW
jgi:hypothetical protein